MIDHCLCCFATITINVKRIYLIVMFVERAELVVAAIMLYVHTINYLFDRVLCLTNWPGWRIKMKRYTTPDCLWQFMYISYIIWGLNQKSVTFFARIWLHCIRVCGYCHRISWAWRGQFFVSIRIIWTFPGLFWFHFINHWD